MKKTSKVFGAIALSAALALGTAVPAFAYEVLDDDKAGVPNYDPAPEVATGTSDVHEQSATGGKAINAESPADSTVVTVSTYTSQISVSIPIKLPVKLDTAGGPGLAPSNYYIENTCVSDLKVTKADYKIQTAARDNWTFAEADYSTINVASGTYAPTTKIDSSEVGMGSLMLTLTPSGKTALKTKITKDSGNGNSVFEGSQADLNWALPNANTADDGNKVGIDVKAYSSKLKKEIKAADAVDVAGIIYTVAIAS